MHIYDKQCVIMHKINGRVQTFRFCVLTMGKKTKTRNWEIMVRQIIITIIPNFKQL